MVTQSRNESKSELEGTVGIVWLNPLIFQVRTLRARELPGLVWNHPMQHGERENYILGLRPQGLGIFSPHRITSQPAQVWFRAASSTLVLVSLTIPLQPPESGGPSLPPAAGVHQLPLRHSGLELVTQYIQSLLFPHLERVRLS